MTALMQAVTHNDVALVRQVISTMELMLMLG